MLTFGKTPQPGPTGGDALVRDTTDQTFMADVVDRSRDMAVIALFTEPLDPASKAMAQSLEAAVNAAGGKVGLSKIDMSRDPMAAQQLRVQGAPTVFAFVGGQPIDGFMGQLAPAQMKQFVDQLAKAADGAAGGAAGAGEPDLGAALDGAEALLAEGATADAAQLFAAVLKADPTELRAVAGLAKAYAAGGDLARARQALSMAPADKAEDPIIASARSQIELAEQTAGAAADLAKHRAALAADPNDLQARFDLALALLATDDREGAVDELLDIFRRDRTWNDEAAKVQLMKLFDAFGPKDPLTLSGRRRLSSMIFA